MRFFLLPLLMLLQMLLPAPTNASLRPDSLAALSEVCQFVREENEKIMDAASNGEDVEEYEEYTTEWTVDVPEGRDVADEIAERLGFINDGPVKYGYLDIFLQVVRVMHLDLQISKDEGNLFRFLVGKEEAMMVPIYQPDDSKTRELTAEESVSSSL